MANDDDRLPSHKSHGRTASLAQQPEQDSVRTKYAWLTVYFGLNLALTLYNKSVMGKVRCGCDIPRCCGSVQRLIDIWLI